MDLGTRQSRNLSTGSLKRTLSPYYSMIVLRNGDLAAASSDRSIRILDKNTSVLKQTLAGHKGTVGSFIELPNGDLASASSDKTIRIWSFT